MYWQGGVRDRPTREARGGIGESQERWRVGKRCRRWDEKAGRGDQYPHWDLISSCLIMLLFFSPNLYMEEMRNTHTHSHSRTRKPSWANTRSIHKYTPMDFKMKHTHSQRGAEGFHVHVWWTKTNEHRFSGEINMTMCRNFDLNPPFLTHTHTHTHIYIPCWEPIRFSVSWGEQRIMIHRSLQDLSFFSQEERQILQTA